MVFVVELGAYRQPILGVDAVSSYLEISEALYEQIEPMRTIDTHEHLFEEPTRLADQLDFSSLFDAYANADLVSAGMSSSDHDRFMSPATDLDDKWRMAAPYWEAARHTGYSTAIRLTIRDLYGADDLNSSTYGPITEKMRAANKPGVIRSVLHDKAGIDWCIVPQPRWRAASLQSGDRSQPFQAGDRRSKVLWPGDDGAGVGRPDWSSPGLLVGL